MKEHTREKLLVYEEYLRNYLFVMCMSNKWSKIFIWEPFAGAGLDKNNERGSALIAAKMISDFREEREKDMQLFLNELDAEKYTQLKQTVSKYDFVNVFNIDAEDFLTEINSALEKTPNKLHNLFFIDPYGYTQYSPDNLSALLKQRNSDYLIFVPTSHLYRFRKEENNPARKFAEDLGVQKSTLEHNGGIDSFAKELTERLKKLAETEFGYNYKLTNREARNSIFHLFFITKHIRGAEKFLKAKNKVKEALYQQSTIQLALFDYKKSEMELYLKEILSQGIDNQKLFHKIIEKGYLPNAINLILRKFERERNLDVRSTSKRRAGAFYLKERPDKIITIRYKK